MKTRKKKKEEKDILDDPLFLAELLGYDRVVHDYHREWIENFIRPGDYVLLAHRNSYKTTCVVIAIILELLMNPSVRIQVARKTEKQAIKILEEVVAHFFRKPLRKLYLDRWGVNNISQHIEWSKMNGLNINLRNKKITKERNLEMCGIGKPSTGAHFDRLYRDDIVTPEDRRAVERKVTADFLKEDNNLLDAKTGLGRNITGTPFHVDDAFSSMTNVHKFPIGMNFIPELTQEKLQAIRKEEGESVFTANYHLEHVLDSERLFDRPNFVSELTSLRKPIAYWDSAFTREGDFNALTIGGMVDDQIHIVHGSVWRDVIDVSYDNVEKACRRHNVHTIVYESNAAQVSLGYVLKQRGLSAYGIYSRGAKAERIIRALRPAWDRIYFYDKECMSEYMRQILNYTEMDQHTYDDAPDSLSSLVSLLESQSKPEPIATFSTLTVR